MSNFLVYDPATGAILKRVKCSNDADDALNVPAGMASLKLSQDDPAFQAPDSFKIIAGQLVSTSVPPTA